MSARLPAEWEDQDGILLPWPHPDSDWSTMLDQVEPVFLEIAQTASRYEQVLIVAPDTSDLPYKLASVGAHMENIRLLDIPTNDTWARDFGPITVYRDGQATPVDFQFTGWGNKFAADRDNQVTKELGKRNIFAAGMPTNNNLVLEGGSIESDGNGTLLTTSRCLLHPNRNPALGKDEIEKILIKEFGLQQILWLNSGFLLGDDTDAHIDILARFAPQNTILYITCDDRQDPHHEELAAMQSELEGLRTVTGNPFRLLKLPMPAPRFDEEGNRLAATYANFLVINNAVLVPVYEDKNDEAACGIIVSAFPGREIVPINCLPLINQGGSLHCTTMQLPKGVLA